MRTVAVALLPAALLFSAPVPLQAQSAARQPELTADAAIQLFEEGGFSIEEGRPLNRCGRASTPRVAFIDLNADGAAEAHIADVDPACYGMPGAYFAILAQQSDRTWKRLIAEDGIVGFEGSRSSGWNDLSLESRDSACPGHRRFNGTDYGAPTACAVFAESAALQPAEPTAAIASNGELSQQHLFDWEGDQTPEAAALSVADQEALFRAAGMEPVGSGIWTGCPSDPSGNSAAQIAMVQDINGDGRAEAMIRDGGSFCNGYAGVSSTVMTSTAEGDWQIVYSNQGFVNFLVSRGADGFPDIEAGLPSSCFPYFRWNGSEYAKVAQLDPDGQPCEPF